MNSSDLYFTSTAVKSFKEIIAHTQETSLIAAEKLRAKIFHKLRSIRHHPEQGSKAVIFEGLQGNYRLATALHVKIYFKVEEDRMVILEMILDK
ncbi:MAG: type II toxin-antitoxin system RelE/ParE family toxin [Flavobacteriales bacterium]|jgi:plasmid stabilization system protein ParE